MAVNFNDNILPLFAKWRTQMIWRMDLADYETVKMNAAVIYQQIASRNMPPPNIATLTDDQIKLFKQWMDAGCPEKAPVA